MSAQIEEPAPEAAVADAPKPAGQPPVHFRDMHLKVGDRVQLEPPAHTRLARLSSLVVGWVERQSLILTVPQTTAGRLCLHPGEVVVVRAFTGRSAYAFRGTVLKKTAKPFDYLHLTFPDVINGVDVRTSPRFRIGLPAKAAADGAAPVAAQIDNMGATGALVACGEPLGRVGDRFQLAFELVLHEVPVALSLQAEIRTVQDAGGTHRHGVAFAPGPNDRLALAAFVWFNMYENPQASI
jgi:hypothetical protein